jgi:glycosyltransferase involved in cell wall biosynthesis
MKILMCNIIYPTRSDAKILGGAELSTKALAEAFGALGHQVTVVRAHAADRPHSVEVVAGIEVISLGIRNIYWPFANQHKNWAARALWHTIDNIGVAPAGFAETLDRVRPDVLHTSNIIGLSWGVWQEAKRRGIPIVHVLRDYYLLCGRGTMFRSGSVCEGRCFDCKVATANRSRQTRLVDAVVGVSQFVLDRHLNIGLFPHAKVRTNIPNIGVAKASAIPRTKPGGLRFGYIGRIDATKGVDQLASAFAATPPGSQLLVAGEADSAQRSKLMELANRPIEFLGFVPPEMFFPHVDVVVVPSNWAEPLGRSILEAHAYGLPVVAADRGGIAEALGKGGWLFDPGDPAALGRLMARIATTPDERPRAAEEARRNAGRFTPETIANAHLAVISQVAQVAGSAQNA